MDRVVDRVAAAGGTGNTRHRDATNLNCLDLQLECRVLVDYDHCVRVHLQTRQSPHMVDATFDAFL